MNVSGHGALVTGGASGLGAATARALAESGAHVGVLDLNEQAGRAIAEDIGGLFAACEVANEASVTSALAQCIEAIGPPRVLVNCAGIGTAARIVGRDGPMELARFEKVIRVNLIGTFNVMRLVAAKMIDLDPLEDGERGVIVSTASVAAYEGQIAQAAYAASKGGIVSMTLPAARELARFGVRVMTIAPGLFDTPLVGELPEEVQAGLAASIPHPPRLGKPEEFADLVMAIVGNPYLNGETIRLDGGLRMAPK